LDNNGTLDIISLYLNKPKLEAIFFHDDEM